MSIALFLAVDSGEEGERLRLLLEAQPDMQVTGVAGNCYDALKQIKQQLPDVVIIRATACQLSGIHIIRKIRRHCPRTRIIFLTDQPNVIQVARALRAGSNGILLQASTEAEIVQAVHTVYDNGRYLSQQVSDMLIEDYVQQRSMAGNDDSPLARLSPRERDVLQLVAESKSSAEIAEMLALSPKTVKTYRSRLMQKLDINNVSSLVKFATQYRLTH